MTRLVLWLLWFFVALHVFLLDGVLADWGTLRIDMTVALCLFMGFHARPISVPGLLLCAAIGRSIVQGGGAAHHVLVMGLPIAAMFPVRYLLPPRSLLFQCVAAGGLAIIVPRVTSFLHRLLDAVPLAAAPTVGVVLWAMLVVPFAVAVLRRLPPLNMLVERRP